MKRLFKVLATLLFLSIIGGVFLYLSVPSVIRYMVQEKAPGVLINGDIEYSMTSLLVKDVSIDTDIAKGNIKEASVKIKWDGYKPSPTDIQVRGGTLAITIPNDAGTPKETDKEKPRLDIKKLVSLVELESVTIKHKKGTAEVGEIAYTKESACANWVIARTPLLPLSELSIVNACYYEDTKKLTLGNVQGSILKVKLPTLDKEIGFEVKDVNVFTNEIYVTAKSAELIGLGIAEGVEVTITADGKPSAIKAERVLSDHKWFPAKLEKLWVLKKVTHGYEVHVGETILLSVEPSERKLNATGECQEIADNLFTGTWGERSDGMFKSGSINVNVSANALSPELTLENNCRAVCSNLMVQKLKSSRFQYKAYKKDGKTRFTRESGSRAHDWAYIELMSEEARGAFITLEDPGFRSHKGYQVNSLLASLKQNLLLGKMHIGGSTITQQLVKNAWLSRDKTLTRKLRELLLTIAVEDCYTKDEILGMYLNVVEFGPDVYGITEGSLHHFDKSYVDLTQAEAFTLAKILPRPNSIRPGNDLERSMKLIEKLKARGFMKL